MYTYAFTTGRKATGFFKTIDSYYQKRVSGIGLGLFRIAYSSVLLLEVIHLFSFRQLIFDPIPYIERSPIDLTPILCVWMGVVVCLVLGLWTRVAAILNYVFTLMTFSVFTAFEYHHDYILIAVNCLFLFAPISQCLSIDSIRKKEPPKGVSVMVYQVFVFLVLALVYFDSIFYKLTSPMWMAGLGLWQPAAAPHAILLDSSWLLDQELLVKFLGYFTIAFEGLFIFLMWFKRMRLPLFL